MSGHQWKLIALPRGAAMTGPTVLPAREDFKRRELRKELKFWKKLLASPDLLERAVSFNEAEYREIRIPEIRRHWLSGETWIATSQWKNWPRETESYRAAIPVGGRRKVGMETCFARALLSDALEELGKRPQDSPNLRHSASQYGSGEDVWWGEDIADIWSQPRTLAVHRATGRAFGYREDRILITYPDDWVDGGGPERSHR
jgi:hypothetical protein